jgi:hypothetical protein
MVAHPKRPLNIKVGSAVSDHITRLLMVPEDRLLDRYLQEINTANKLALKLQCDGFLYDGEFEIPKYNANRLPNKGQLKGLSPDLFDRMEELKKLRRESQIKQAFCHQVLYSLLQPCETMQDVRDALPEHLWSFFCENRSGKLGDFHLLERQRPELYTIANNEPVKRLYAKFEEQIAVMLVGRLMY